MADVVGMLVLTAEILLTALLLRGAGIPTVLWIVIAVAVLVTAYFFWRSEQAPKETSGWFSYAAGSVVVGVIFFACDVWIGGLGRANLSIFEAAKNAGGPFGFALTLALCPGLTFICIAGSVRAGIASLKDED